MTEERHLTCINCPMGCPLTVTIEDGKAVSVTGNTFVLRAVSFAWYPARPRKTFPRARFSIS